MSRHVCACEACTLGLRAHVRHAMHPPAPGVQRTACPTHTWRLERINLVPTFSRYRVSEYMIWGGRLEKWGAVVMMCNDAYNNIKI